MYQKLLRPIAWAILGICSIPAGAEGVDVASTKDIIERTLVGQNTGNSAVKLSFLVLNKDGSPQMERAAHYPFYSGELIRVKIISGQSGTLQLTNINATGKVTPMRAIPVQAGVPAYYPPENNAVLEFANSTGNEILRVAFTPPAPSSNWGNNNQPAYPAPNPSQQPYVPPSNNPVQTPNQQTSGAVSSNPAYSTPIQQSEGVMNGNYGGGVQGQGNPYPVQGSIGNQSPTPSGVGEQVSAPIPPSRPSEFFSGVQGKAYAYAKDIRETVLETPNATYLIRPVETGAIQFDVTIQHRNY